MSKAKYKISEEARGYVRLTWTRNGVADPLNFWDVPFDEVERAKERIKAGEMD